MAQKSRLPGILLTLGIVMVVVGYKACFNSTEKKLVEHVVVTDISLAPNNGRRIEIHCSTPGLTKEKARKLIAHYEYRAGAEGHVSVHKRAGDGKFWPWAYWDGGEETKFKDYIFDNLGEYDSGK